MRIISIVLLLLCQLSFAVGSWSSPTRTFRSYGKGGPQKNLEEVSTTFTGDASDGTVPVQSIQLCGFLVKVITNPGTTAPTASYDAILGDPKDNALDAAAGFLANRHTSTTEVVYPVGSGAAAPIFLCGAYALTVTNNSVASATSNFTFYLVD